MPVAKQMQPSSTTSARINYHRADPKLADAARQTDEYKASMARWNAANPPRR